MIYKIHCKQQGVSSERLIRIPILNCAYPDEKVRGEVGAAKFLQHTCKTTIPTPRIFEWVDGEENPKTGPFTVIEYFNNTGDLFKLWTKPESDVSTDLNQLDFSIPEAKLKKIDKQLAQFLLELLPHRFTEVGALACVDNHDQEVGGRPWTLDMQFAVELANIPQSALPGQRTYSTADEWFVACSRKHVLPLLFQQNMFLPSADDCRNKFVARCVFHRLAKEGKLSVFGFEEDTWSAQSEELRAQSPGRILCSAPNGPEDFSLWIDDLRPSNVLMGEDDEIAAIIDLEYSYAAPLHFALDPPWWLVVARPSEWEGGIEDWALHYSKRLETWLAAIKEAEVNFGPERTGLSPGMPLSRYMHESWETGRFWVNFALRKTWSFDFIYWKFLDERFFGKRPADVPRTQWWALRHDLLSERERELMESFVQGRMEETKERKLVDDWDEDEVERRIAEFFGAE